MNSNKNGSSGGVGFCGLLTLIFITLKLVGVINWSWTMVFSPIWMPIIVVLIILIVYELTR